MREIKFADLFAGGGGVTTGAFSIPGLHVSWALNHDKTAIETHAINHPETKHYQADIRTQDVSELERVDVLWASTECTQFSKAKGGGLKDIGSYMLAWELIRYILHLRPLQIFIENVPEFVKWAPLIQDKHGNWIPDETKKGEEYQRWVNHLCSLGYQYEYRFQQAADYDAPTRRVRYIGIFTQLEIPILWPVPVRSQKPIAGLKPWRACRSFIDLDNEGQSMFDRSKPYCPNTRRRFAGGVLKNSGLLQGLIKSKGQFISKYYSAGVNCHGLDEPLHTIRTKDSHLLITVEKRQFIADHTQTDNYQDLDYPLRAQLTRQTKQLINLKTQFLSTQNSSCGKPEHNTRSLDEPLGSICTKEKHQFVTSQFNSGGKPESQISSLDCPLNSITTNNCFNLATLEIGSHPEYFTRERLEFASMIYQVAVGEAAAQPVDLIRALSFCIKDVKARFLHKDELGPIMGFPKGYFAHLSNKKAIKLIGNAVPTWLARAMLLPNIEYLQTYLTQKAS